MTHQPSDFPPKTQKISKKGAQWGRYLSANKYVYRSQQSSVLKAGLYFTFVKENLSLAANICRSFKMQAILPFVIWAPTWQMSRLYFICLFVKQYLSNRISICYTRILRKTKFPYLTNKIHMFARAGWRGETENAKHFFCASVNVSKILLRFLN